MRARVRTKLRRLVFEVFGLTAATKRSPLVSQDSAIKRPANETILAEGDMVTGVNTKFTELFQDRDKLRFRGKSEQFKVGKEDVLASS